ncbi:RNA polymerase sigma factor [Streptomyces cavernae]|uniref:RNA polymerase sigma factor n=1 Tax=Streptomyces cavernae TaxID=2259034 RepID=UPI000FEBDC4C|nr:sigma-70 family RNA polymerase sigma factor [Streptomyces cavernae]
MDGRQWRSTIAAAQSGDRRALDELVEGWLPLVYNIVGRALNGHADVDDVVQETMMRAVDNLGTLRDPDSFRSWLVVIAMRQIRDRARRRTSESLADDAARDAADFADLTVLRLQLEGQRREVAEAVRWLDDEDRQLLSLWWLEVAGELSRRELAAAAGISRQHAAVKVQRMKARLEAARGIVRALDASCPRLREVTARWDGRTDSVWRKRLARHVRDCARCSGRSEEVVPAERLLVGIALVPVPVGFTLAFALGGKTAAAATGAAGAAVPVGWSAKVLGVLGKPAVAVTAGATIAAGGVYVVSHEPDGPRPQVVMPTTPTTAPPTSATPSTSPTAAPSPPSNTPRTVRNTPARVLYGTVVDAVDRAPDPGARPAALPRRPETGVISSGGPRAVMNHRGENVTLKGRGYLLVRWQLSPQYRAGGLVMPSWSGLEGKLFHVASGGGRRMDDVFPDSTDGATGMGGPSTGYAVLPPGTQQMWQNEYFYLDGTVTLTQNERGCDYGVTVFPRSWEEVNQDVMTGPDQGVIRYGLVRDNGKDTAPVPQYLTRAKPDDPATVPQRSQVAATP